MVRQESHRVAPLRPTATLTSLPIELLTHIALKSDRRTGLALARVCRKFTSAAEHRIYQSLDLFLSPSYGEHPLIQPHKRSGHGAHVTWAKAEARRAEDRHREGLREKIKSIMVNAGARRLGMVEKVTIVQRPGAVNAVLALLDVLSPNLRELEMRAPAHHVFAQDWRTTDYETFDVKIIEYGLSFPSLTHIHINNGAIRFAETLIILCHASPNLISLIANLGDNTAYPTWDEDMVDMPLRSCDHRGLPRLRYLQLAFRDRDDGADDDDYHPLVSIVEASPNLEEFSLRYDGEADGLMSYLTEILSDKENLRDLHINIDPETFRSRFNALDEETPAFPALERLVLRSDENLDFLKAFHVERPHISKRLFPPEPTDYPEPSPCLSMLPAFTESLRKSPHVSTIHSIRSISAKETKFGLDTFPMFDKLESMDDINGTVRSFVHNGEELLHARLFLDHFEIYDKTCDEDPNHVAPGKIQIRYEAGGEERKRVFEQRSEASWQDFTDWDGYRVPLEVLQAMRLAQGAKLQDWQGRGVIVEDKAWKVLTDWRAKVDKENEKEEQSA